MFGITHFISNVLHDAAAMIAVAFVYLKFWSRSAWQSPNGRKIRAWCEANPARTAVTALGVIWVFVALRFMDAVSVLTAGHRHLSLTWLLVGGFLALTARREWGARSRYTLPPTINGTARPTVNQRQPRASGNRARTG